METDKLTSEVDSHSMPASEKKIAWSKLINLLTGQRFGVLSTAADQRPYSNLVAFAADHEYKNLIFATSKSTRKFMNLIQNPVASFLVDNRTNQSDDLQNASAVTAIGSVYEIETKQGDASKQLYLEKHPTLESFIRSEDSALLSLEVERYIVVLDFQNVVDIEIKGDRVPVLNSLSP